MTEAKYEFLLVEKVAPFVVNVQLNRPTKYNVISVPFWREVGACFRDLAVDPEVRAIVLSGNGKAFSAGIDLYQATDLFSFDKSADGPDSARRGRELRHILKEWQEAFSFENCPKPVIVAVHGFCWGAGLDLIAGADVRFACRGSDFSVKEVDVALADDVGALNRLNKICGSDSWVREVCMSARHFDEQEALRQGFVSRIFPTREEMMTEAVNLAKLMASKSPVAVQGTKINLNYSRDHSVRDSLDFIAAWNMSQLQTDDIPKAAMAIMNKQGPPTYSKL